MAKWHYRSCLKCCHVEHRHAVAHFKRPTLIAEILTLTWLILDLSIYKIVYTKVL